MAQFASDPFTGTSGTELSAYNAAWTRHASASAASVDARISNANRCRGTTGASGAAVYYHSGTPAGTDYSVSVDVTEITDAMYAAGPCARISTISNTMYHARWATFVSPDVVQLYRFVAGVATQLGTDQSANFTTGTTRNLKIECINSGLDVIINVYIDGSGTPLFSVTDIAANGPITTAGLSGIRLGYGGASIPSDTTCLHLDNYSADDVGGGTTYTITPSGGIVIAGVGPILKTKIFLPSGGISFGGTAPISGVMSFTIAPSGGIAFSGTGSMTSSNAATYTITPTGGLNLSGGSTMIKSHIHIPVGGIVFGGSAPIESNTVVSTVTTRLPLTGVGG